MFRRGARRDHVHPAPRRGGRHPAPSARGRIRGPGRPRLLFAAGCVALGALAWVAPPAPALTMDNNTPFASSSLLIGARWITPRYDPPGTQYGDILPISWADDGSLYAMVDDGGLLRRPYRRRRNYYPKRQWKQFLVRISGEPPHVSFNLVGRGEALGHVYSNGFVSVYHTFYATRTRNWAYGRFGPFRGLYDIAYSVDRGRHWIFGAKQFSSRAGNLNWVMEGKDQPNGDGYLYAIANEREFNASNLYLGRVRPTRRQVPNPDAWQWWNPSNKAQGGWGRDLNLAEPVLSWPDHITYPRMSFDPGLGRYLLSFSYSYANESNPATFTGGAELVVLESPAPWGPYRFVFREPYWGPSNGYGGSFPIKWQSADGRTLWMYWASNWDITDGGCLARLDCSGRYGYNLRELRLTVARPAP